MPSSLQLVQATVQAGVALFCRRDGKILDQVLAQSNLAVIAAWFTAASPSAIGSHSPSDRQTPIYMPSGSSRVRERPASRGHPHRREPAACARLPPTIPHLISAQKIRTVFKAVFFAGSRLKGRRSHIYGMPRDAYSGVRSTRAAAWSGRAAACARQDQPPLSHRPAEAMQASNSHETGGNHA